MELLDEGNTDTGPGRADNPSILFAEELITAYPDAKVILTTRDPDRWWKSYIESLQAIHRSPMLASPYGWTRTTLDGSWGSHREALLSWEARRRRSERHM
jgi:hypothetical protein